MSASIAVTPIRPSRVGRSVAAVTAALIANAVLRLGTAWQQRRA